MSFLEWLRAIFAAIFAPVSAKPVPTSDESARPEPRSEAKEMPWRTWLIVRDGWGEHNTADVAELSKGWRFTKFCKSYRTIVGATYAWCGMGLATALQTAGYKFPVQCESADKWIGYGTPINWKKDGIPKGAVVVVKGDSYHVSTAEEDHAPGFVSVLLRGCNQDNKICMKRDYREVVWVGWPVKE